MKRLFYPLLVAILFLEACSTAPLGLHQALRTSPHRQLAIIPLTPADRQEPFAAQATERLTERLSRMGFDVMVLNPLAPKIRRPTQAALAAAQKAHGGAVLVGRIEESAERIDRHPDT